MKLAVTILCLSWLLAAGMVHAQAVLGPCGQPEESGQERGEQIGQAAYAQKAIEANRVPLPGERAIDFELTAVVGDEIKKVKLSDYQGKYRVLCFYPADFTFV
jgi:hypothetical protein